jgi:hypothetical protein
MLKLPPEPMATKEMVRQKFDEVKVLQCAVERVRWLMLSTLFDKFRGPAKNGLASERRSPI